MTIVHFLKHSPSLQLLVPSLWAELFFRLNHLPALTFIFSQSKSSRLEQSPRPRSSSMWDLDHPFDFSVPWPPKMSSPENVSRSVVSNSVSPWTAAPRLLRPQTFPGEDTAVGRHFLLQYLPHPGTEPRSAALQANLLPLRHQGIVKAWSEPGSVLNPPILPLTLGSSVLAEKNHAILQHGNIIHSLSSSWVL